VKEWLLKHGITADSMCAAASFACECVADVCDGLLEACRGLASSSLPKVKEGALCGVRADAMFELLRAYAENEYLGRACDVAEGFMCVQRWARANAGVGVENKDAVHKEAMRLTEMLELSLLPASFLSKHVRTSGLVSADKVWQMHEDVVMLEKESRLASTSMRLRCASKLSASLPQGRQFATIGRIAVSGRGPKQRVAVIDHAACCVHVFSLEDMKLLWVAGSKGKAPGQFIEAFGVAFDGRGYLFVSDLILDRVQVFDCEGKFVRCFGKLGSGPGELSQPGVMSLTAQGDILVCDTGNNRVQVFEADGRFVRVVPSPDDPQKVTVVDPWAVLATADGNMIVADDDCVRMFNSDGLFVKEIKPPHVQGEHWEVFRICTGPRGELFAFEEDTSTMRVLDSDGALLWTAKLDGWEPFSMAMDWRGRLICRPEQTNDVFICERERLEAR
jgi:hypothetical protein